MSLVCRATFADHPWCRCRSSLKGSLDSRSSLPVFIIFMYLPVFIISCYLIKFSFKCVLLVSKPFSIRLVPSGINLNSEVPTLILVTSRVVYHSHPDGVMVSCLTDCYSFLDCFPLFTSGYHMCEVSQKNDCTNFFYHRRCQRSAQHDRPKRGFQGHHEGRSRHRLHGDNPFWSGSSRGPSELHSLHHRGHDRLAVDERRLRHHLCFDRPSLEHLFRVDLCLLQRSSNHRGSLLVDFVDWWYTQTHDQCKSFYYRNINT